MMEINFLQILITLINLSLFGMIIFLIIKFIKFCVNLSRTSKSVEQKLDRILELIEKDE